MNSFKRLSGIGCWMLVAAVATGVFWLVGYETTPPVALAIPPEAFEHPSFSPPVVAPSGDLTISLSGEGLAVDVNIDDRIPCRIAGDTKSVGYTLQGGKDHVLVIHCDKNLRVSLLGPPVKADRRARNPNTPGSLRPNRP